jgi:hypothetical protein
LIEHSRRRHLKLRPRLEAFDVSVDTAADAPRVSQFLSPGV